MKKLTVITAAILMASFLLFSCSKDELYINGEGSIITKTLVMENIKGFNLAEAGNVIVTQGPVQEIHVTGHGNIIDRLQSNVSDEIWNIELRKDNYRNYELTVFITVPEIENIMLSGAGTVTVGDFIDQNSDLSLAIPGSGDIILNAFQDVNNINVDISGSGSIRVEGEVADVQKLDVEISGSGSFEGFPAESNNCDLNISGSGDCFVFVKNSLDVRISGSGNVYYKGNPSISQHVNSAGSINNWN